jgi:anti-anti-sigma factor
MNYLNYQSTISNNSSLFISYSESIGHNIIMETQTKKHDNGVLILYLTGRLDATTSGPLQKEISELITSGEHRLLINFSQLDYISSAGLRVLIITLKSLKTHQGQLLICNMGEAILEVLKVAGFTKILTIEETEEQALTKFN